MPISDLELELREARAPMFWAIRRVSGDQAIQWYFGPSPELETTPFEGGGEARLMGVGNTVIDMVRWLKAHVRDSRAHGKHQTNRTSYSGPEACAASVPTAHAPARVAEPLIPRNAKHEPNAE